MKRMMRMCIALVGFGTGCGLVAAVVYSVRYPGYEYVMRYTTMTEVLIALYAIVGLLFGLIFYHFSPRIAKSVRESFQRVDEQIGNTPARDLLFGVIGLVIGLFVAFLMSFLVNGIRFSMIRIALMLGLYFLLGYFGCRTGVKKGSELLEGTRNRRDEAETATAKVLDTSAIIDGRILDVCKTGIVEGKLIIPSFVLKELRHIADSSDPLRRARGRRGLDIIKQMQSSLTNTVLVEERDYKDEQEVDLKLLRLAADYGGVLITNDFNLNKVASVHQVRVLNVNELANALRPILLAGEELSLLIVKEGKEQGQGIGYLPDGTMVIVDGGRRHIGATIELVVTSSLQTAAGRMIFARPHG